MKTTEEISIQESLQFEKTFISKMKHTFKTEQKSG